MVANLYLGPPGAQVVANLYLARQEALAATLPWDPGRGHQLLQEPHL